MPPDHRPLLALLTPTLDPAPDALDTTTTAIAGLRRRGIEVQHVVVDGGSQPEVLERLRALRHTQLVERPGANIAESLTLAWSQATADFVAVVNAGDRPRPALAEAARRLAADRGRIGLFPVHVRGGSTVRPRWVGRALGSRWIHAGLVAERSLLDEIGGYDRRYQFAMDWEWLSRADRAGIRCDVHPEAEPVMEIEPFGLSRQRVLSAMGEYLDVVRRDCPQRAVRWRLVARQLPAFVRAVL